MGANANRVPTLTKTRTPFAFTYAFSYEFAPPPARFRTRKIPAGNGDGVNRACRLSDRRRRPG